MKKALLFSTIVACGATSLYAQKPQEEKKVITVTIEESQKSNPKKNSKYVSVGLGGVRVSSKEHDVKIANRKFNVEWGMLDLGLNTLVDKTDYSTKTPTLMNNFSGIPADKVNADLFSLKNGRSWNVNIYPVMFSYKAVDAKKFKMYLYSGLGLQIYNFRFNKNISFLSEPDNKIILDSVAFTKNKLAFNYLTVPLMLNFKHKIDNAWFTYGFGGSIGYRLNSWTKQISSDRGKQKNHDAFNFNNFNVNLIGEIGVDNIVRFYVSYQVTNLYKDGIGLQQHPLSFGVRFGGI